MRAGWYMYDWANSAFAVTILAALFGPYLDKVVMPPGGIDIPALGLTKVSATALYGYLLGFSALVVLLTSPILGAIADYGGYKKRFLMGFCAVGSVSTMLFTTVGPGDVWLAAVLFFLANVCFVSANVFYDAFLPHIAAPEEQDQVSGRGYAYGYAGGGLLFVLHLLLVQFHEAVGIAETSTAIRIALGSAGVWWGGFSLITFARLKEERQHGSAPLITMVAHGFRRIGVTMRKARRLRQLLIFLVAFMIYNDGIQTVIAMSTIYGSEELHFDTLTLMGCLLMVQAVGIAGSQIFGKLAGRLGTKRSILLSLAIWSGVVCYAYFMQKPIEFWILGAVVGFVLGGSQALSRSLFSKIIPPKASAEFFGFFSVFEKFSAIWGPLVFATIQHSTGSARNSIISLVVFFVVGGGILAFLRPAQAAKESAVLAEEL